VDHFRKVIKKAKLRHIRFQDLRHTCASLLLNKNIHLKFIQEWLGHSCYQSTLRYAYLDSKSKVESGLRLDDTFRDINFV